MFRLFRCFEMGCSLKQHVYKFTFRFFDNSGESIDLKIENKIEIYPEMKKYKNIREELSII